MRIARSSEELVALLESLDSKTDESRKLILIGGCSQVGKTTLVNQIIGTLASRGIVALSLSLDHWIVSVDKRGQNSSVIERYEIEKITNCIKIFMAGNAITPPVYDPVKRIRVKESGDLVQAIDKGFVIVEGVLALAMTELVRMAMLRIFVRLDDRERRKRLVRFYRDIKGYDKRAAMEIISERELEEVSFVERTVANADIVFSSNKWEE